MPFLHFAKRSQLHLVSHFHRLSLLQCVTPEEITFHAGSARPLGALRNQDNLSQQRCASQSARQCVCACVPFCVRARTPHCRRPGFGLTVEACDTAVAPNGRQPSSVSNHGAIKYLIALLLIIHQRNRPLRGRVKPFHLSRSVAIIAAGERTSERRLWRGTGSVRTESQLRVRRLQNMLTCCRHGNKKAGDIVAALRRFPNAPPAAAATSSSKHAQIKQ